jgi:heme exporter protein A
MAVFSGSDLGCERGERVVFDRVSFHIPGGGVTELRGANGSGKSTLLRIMAGLLPPTRGTIAWNGILIDEDRDAHRARINYIGHLDGVKGTLTVAENLRFWGEMTRGAQTDRQIRDQSDLALATFGISHLADLPARALSAGQRRRVALGRLIMRPALIWLLDEPASALDTSALATLDHAMAAHLGAGGIVIMATHEPVQRPTPRVDLDEFARIAATKRGAAAVSTPQVGAA